MIIRKLSRPTTSLNPRTTRHLKFQSCHMKSFGKSSHMSGSKVRRHHSTTIKPPLTPPPRKRSKNQNVLHSIHPLSAYPLEKLLEVARSIVRLGKHIRQRLNAPLPAPAHAHTTCTSTTASSRPRSTADAYRYMFTSDGGGHALGTLPVQ